MEERNSESPVQMEAMPTKASPASWGPWLPSPSERIELHREHTGLFWWWRGTRFHSSDKACSPYTSASREEAEPTPLEVRLLNPVTSV